MNDFRNRINNILEEAERRNRARTNRRETTNNCNDQIVDNMTSRQWNPIYTGSQIT